MLLPYNFHAMLSLLYVLTSPNLKLIAHIHTELWSFKVVNVDVCGSLVLSNPVTYRPQMFQSTHNIHSPDLVVLIWLLLVLHHVQQYVLLYSLQ